MIFRHLLCLLAAALAGVAAHQDNPTARKSASDCSNTTIEYFNYKLNLCCSKCKPDQEEVQPCTSTSMRVCLCRKGSYCIDATGKTCNQCRKHTKCNEGHGVVEQGTKDTDVSCEPCTSGTFSNVVSSTEPCRPHTECAVLGRKTLRKGSSTNDTICSSKLLPQVPTQRNTEPMTASHPPALTQVTYWTKMETVTMNVLESNHGASAHFPHWWVALFFGIFALIAVVAGITVCLHHKRKGRKHDLETDMPVRDVSQVEAICLISGNETEGEGMVAGDQTCKQNGGPTSVGDQLPSLPMKSSGDSQGTRRKPDLGNGLKEEDRSQANFAAPNNYSPMDCQEDQGYISRESRPSSGTPSPVMEFSGNPTVSVTINTGKCFVNCYHYQEERASGPGSEEDQYHAPEEEEGAEVDEGFPIQEEQRDLDSGKEDGGSAEAAHKDFWRYNPVPHQEEGKESHFPVQDTSGNVY
ncbi:tumor necrosis factor receptor superfamily member 1B-like isoform X2 [Narcine bancroftii]|uniref:tumor necrosis factor receptor superfamily member 1B-like isoform X2 n=1 Tax=Narcine bancroftii TaxID=1343680 RepID=UPI0038321501